MCVCARACVRVCVFEKCHAPPTPEIITSYNQYVAIKGNGRFSTAVAKEWHEYKKQQKAAPTTEAESGGAKHRVKPAKQLSLIHI